jgi:segregation and condensation protein B
LALEVVPPRAAPAEEPVEDGEAVAEEPATAAASAEDERVAEMPADEAEIPEEASPEPSSELVPDALATPETPEADAAPEAIAGVTEPEPELPPASTAALAKDERDRSRRLRGYFREVLDKLVAEYAAPESDRGLEIREVAGGFRFATKPEYHDAVRGFVKSLKPPLKLSLQALETLAVVAYKQPVTAPEISEIRGVDSGGVLGSLLMRKLIATAGKKQVIGRPILYKTTKEFLLRFGLKDLDELPSIEEFEKLAGQMAEQEEIPMGENGHEAEKLAEELEPERESHESQADGEFAPYVEEPSAADDVPEITGDKASVDGRLGSLPPDYTDDSDDPSAEEGRIQGGGE